MFYTGTIKYAAHVEAANDLATLKFRRLRFFLLCSVTLFTATFFAQRYASVLPLRNCKFLGFGHPVMG